MKPESVIREMNLRLFKLIKPAPGVRRDPRFVRTPPFTENYVDIKEVLNEGTDINACDAGYTALSCSVETGNAEYVEEMIMRGADVDLTDGYRYPPLMMAAQKGSKDIVRLLLQHKADVTRESRMVNHLAALDMAVASEEATDADRCEIVTLLLQHKASAQIDRPAVYSGKSPYERARESGHSAVLKLFDDEKSKNSSKP